MREITRTVFFSVIIVLCVNAIVIFCPQISLTEGVFCMNL